MGDKIFDFPKDVSVISQLLNLVLRENEIALDFFAGSGTLAEAILEINKSREIRSKFILVQLPEPIEEDSRPFNAGYKTIAEISKERIRRVIMKIAKEKAEKTDMFNNAEQDLGFKVFKLTSSNFKIWRSNEITEDNLVQQLEAFTNPVHVNSPEQNMLYELML